MATSKTKNQWPMRINDIGHFIASLFGLLLLPVCTTAHKIHSGKESKIVHQLDALTCFDTPISFQNHWPFLGLTTTENATVQNANPGESSSTTPICVEALKLKNVNWVRAGDHYIFIQDQLNTHYYIPNEENKLIKVKVMPEDYEKIYKAYYGKQFSDHYPVMQSVI